MRTSTINSLLCLTLMLGYGPAQAAVQRWECTVIDSQGQRWSHTHTYRPPALYHALEACKRDSAYPESCHHTTLGCELFINGHSTRPFWRCTALDRQGGAWVHQGMRNRMDAALASKARCQQHSRFPSTCYVYTFTCKNLNALE